MALGRSTSPSTATISRRAPQPVVHATSLDLDLSGATIVLVDDVLYTGRTIRAAIEALFERGRPRGSSSPSSSTAATGSS